MRLFLEDNKLDIIIFSNELLPRNYVSGFDEVFFGSNAKFGKIYFHKNYSSRKSYIDWNFQ